jgi:uncharacterized protein
VKDAARLLAVDDAPFRKGDASVPIVGVVTSGASYVEGVLTSRVRVDGADGTAAIVRLVRRSRFRPLLRGLLLNGIFVGGFNLVDVDRVHERTGLPTVAVVRSAPRPALVKRAVQAAFEDWRPRWERIAALEPVKLPGVRLWGTVRGLSLREASRLVSTLTVRGNVPEPLRLAHVIASGLVRGESRGKA